MHFREVIGVGVMVLAGLIPVGLLHGQQETAAALAGMVVDRGKNPVEAAQVEVDFLPTGGHQTTRTNGKGLFSLGGLPVGGPYVVTIAAKGFESQRMEDVSLGLGEARWLDITLGAAQGTEPTIRLEKVEVVAARETLVAGPRTTLSRDEIERQPTIDGSLNEFAARDPRLVYLDPERGELEAVGQNSRYNSISVDGIRINDQFGVGSTGFPSQGNPLSLETVEAISVEVSPYDVYRGGFTGASINVVTKGGTNRFRGSVYYSYRDQNWRAKHPVTGERDPFSDETYGITFGGPLWRDHLFLFSSYEHSQRIEPAPSAGFEPSADALQRIATISAGYGYNPGAMTNPGQQNKQDNKYLGKIDWQISPRQRLSLRYSETHGNQPVFTNYSTAGRVSLSGHWYDSTQDLTAWSAQLFSQWTPALYSEMKVASHRHESTRTPRTRFPQVRIENVPGASGDTGAVYLGGEYSSQVNALSVATDQAGALTTWLLGRHRVLFGAEIESTEFDNTFLQNAWGSYIFASVDAYETGKPRSFTYQYMLDGRSPTVSWGYKMGSAFIQDSWVINRHLTMTGGVRFDYPWANAKPHRNYLVEETFGRRNDRTFDGAYVLGPRGSFALKFGKKDRTEIHGGAGVFQGRSPGVWLSNAYSNDGQFSAVNTTINGFSPDPDNQPKGNPAAARQRVDLVDKDFHMPSVARASLGVDQKLPWQNLVLGFDVVQSWTLQGLAYKNLNLRQTGTGPDGRAIYGDRTKTYGLVSNSQFASTSFTDVYLLKNTGKGQATHATISLHRPLRHHWGASLSYTRGASSDVSPVTSSTAATNYSTRASLDPNDERLGTSNYEIRDRVLASLTVKFALVKKFDTKITLYYEGRSGRPYSFITSNDVNGDASEYDNDLLYVPSGRDDPKVRWASASQADAFFAYVDRNPALKRFAGRVAARNSERSYYQHRYDLKFAQEIPLHGRLKSELFFDILNLANLLDDDWGRVYAANFPYGLAVVDAKYDPVANQYVYRFTGAKEQTLQASLSRWQLQGGVRVKF